MAGPAPTPAPQNYGQTGTTPAGTAPMTTGSNYQWVDNGAGGVNYTLDGQPITREQFASGSGNDVGAIENSVTNHYDSLQPSGQTPNPQVLGDSTSNTGGALTSAQLYAQQQAKYQQGVKDNVAVQNPGDISAANTGIDQYGAQDYSAGIHGLVTTATAGQHALDANVTNNELARMQGHQGILDMVGNGIQSGGVMLANKNAGDSSASEALARAYGLLGRQQESKVGNQFEQGVVKDSAAQDVFDAGNKQSMLDLNTKKNDFVNTTVNTARSQLTALNSMLAGANLSDRLDIQNEIQGVKDHAAGQLQQYDQMLTDQMGGIQQEGNDAARQKAATLQAAGVADPTQFNYQTSAPLTAQGTGPTPSALPLYLKPKTAA